MRRLYRYRYWAASLLLASGVLLSATLDSGTASNTAPKSEYSALEPLVFELDYLGGVLTIEGHSGSTDHEQAIATGAERFPNNDIRLRPAVITPQAWDVTTVAVLDAVAATQSATVRVTDSLIELRAVYVDEEAWEKAIVALESIKPTSVSLTTDALRVTVPTVEPCRAAYRELQRQSIKFEQSSAQLRRANYGVLDRHADFAADCSNYRIAVTGHSDNQGDEDWNRELSRLRAQAVADYLRQRGVPEARLLVAGAGSAEPVADNETAWGRIRNRRIEFELLDL